MNVCVCVCVFKKNIIYLIAGWKNIKALKKSPMCWTDPWWQVEGENLWQWVRIIAALKKHKVIWPSDRYNDPESQIFIVTVDGVDFRCFENRRHATLPYNKGEYSKKFNHSALKYEIAIDCYTSKIVWLNGPFRGGEHDANIFNSVMQEKIPKGKFAVADRVYRNK